MDTRVLVKALVTLSNGLLGVSLVLGLVWWVLSLRLFVAGWMLYGAGTLLAPSSAVEPAVLAMPDVRG